MTPNFFLKKKGNGKGQLQRRPASSSVPSRGEAKRGEKRGEKTTHDKRERERKRRTSAPFLVAAPSKLYRSTTTPLLLRRRRRFFSLSPVLHTHTHAQKGVSTSLLRERDRKTTEG